MIVDEFWRKPMAPIGILVSAFIGFLLFKSKAYAPAFVLEPFKQVEVQRNQRHAVGADAQNYSRSLSKVELSSAIFLGVIGLQRDLAEATQFRRNSLPLWPHYLPIPTNSTFGIGIASHSTA